MLYFKWVQKHCSFNATANPVPESYPDSFVFRAHNKSCKNGE